MSQPVVHFEVVGKDAKRLQDFYGKAFDWRMEPAGPDYAMVHPAGEDGLAGGVGAAMDGSEGRVTFYVGVPNLEAALKKIEALGGQTAFGPADVPGGPRIAHFTDPEGHRVGLVQTA